MYDVITVPLYIDVRACDMYFFYYCASLTCTVCMYIYICIFNIYCIVRSVPMRGTSKNSLGHRNALRQKENFFIYSFFFYPKRRSYGVIARARSRVSRNSARPFVESHTTFPPDTPPLQKRYIEISFYSPAYSNPRVKSASRRPTAHVYLRFISSSKFLTRDFPIDFFFSLYLSLRFDTCSDDWSQRRMRILVSLVRSR